MRNEPNFNKVKRDFSLRQGKAERKSSSSGEWQRHSLRGGNKRNGYFQYKSRPGIGEHFDAASAEKILYLCHMAVAPQGRTIPLAVTGRPISSADSEPPISCGNRVPSTYCITEGERPVV